MIYIEEEVADHWRTHEICSRLPDATRVECRDYRDVFDRAGQDFRLQKQHPSLILATRRRQLVEPAPAGYAALGGRRSFAFSVMGNCIYDCRYCFLQGLNRSAFYLIFVNYEDYMAEIDERLAESPEEDIWFFAGYDADSLAFEPVTRFARSFLPFFAERPRAWVELRTKSTQIKALLDHPTFPNCVPAFSLTPPELSRGLEHQTPAVDRRVDAAARLQEAGWSVGLRFDPLIWHEGFESTYEALFDEVFTRLDPARLHSVSLGPFRLPSDWWRRVTYLYPDEDLFQGPMEEHAGTVAFRPDLQERLKTFCTERLRQRVREEILFPEASGI